MDVKYTTTSSFIETFRNIELVKNPYFQIFLFFCFPKYIILLSIIPIVQKIIYILNDKAIKLIEANNKNIQIQNNLVISLSSIIASRDKTTGNHVRNSSKYAAFLVQKLRDTNIFKEELTEEYAGLVEKAAILHDVGKIKISDTILCKNGKLTAEEYEEIKKHTIYGQEIMKELIKGIDNSEEYLDIATKMALSHHERYDGKGYPYGLKGDEIPLCARIMAVADVLDALLSKRQYKEYDKQFDGKILKILLDNWEEFKKIERD